MRSVAAFSVAVLVGFSVSGCATVVNGTNVDYVAESRPEGATVVFTNNKTCKTPCKIEQRRKDDLRADITLDGYKPAYVLIQSKLGGATFGNILLGGGVGAIVDGTNGASNKLYPQPLIIRLAPIGSDEEAMLLDKKGNEVMTVNAHNDSVRVDVAKTIGPKLAGIEKDDVADVADVAVPVPASVEAAPAAEEAAPVVEESAPVTEDAAPGN